MKQALNGIDLLKFLMAILIVAEHSCLYYDLLGDAYLDTIVKNISCMCVPTFFIISSFFFFSKLRKLHSRNEKCKQVWKFEKRIISLYLFWGIVGTPYAIYIQLQRGFDDLPLVQNLFHDFSLGFSFIGSWFLGAMIIGIPLITLCIRGGQWRKALFVIAVTLLYIYVYQPDAYPALDVWWREYIGSPKLSVLRGLLWLIIGCLLSTKGFLKRMQNVPYYWIIILFIISLLASPCYPIEYSSIPASILLFVCAYRLKLKDSPLFKKLRIYSIVIYCSHGTVLPVVSFLFHPGHFIWEAVVLLICCCMAEIICRLSQIPKFGFLRFTY